MFLNFLFSQQHVLRNIWIFPIPQHVLSFFLSNIFHMILWMLSFDFEHQNFVATNELFSTGSSLCFRFTSFWDIKFYFYFGRLSLSLVNRWPLVCVSFNWMFRFSKHITLLRLPRYLMRIHNTKCYSLFLSLSIFDINVIFSSFCFSWNWYFYAIILLATQNTNKTMLIARMQPTNWLKLWREYAQKRRNRLRNRRNIFIQLFLKSVDNNLEIEQQFSYSFYYWCLIIYS